MTQIPKAYNAKAHEDKIYSEWEKSGAFKPSSSEKPAFTIAMPPPNATGQLHLGHATMLALQDIMTRYHRMKGHPTLWLPGTDHAAIATQSVVERKLQKEGMAKPRQELGREKLLEAIKDFVSDSKDTIRNQVRKMGASCDWSREKYTLDDDLNHAVNTLFQYMVEDELIYHGGRIVNWDPNMQTTVADDELEYVEEKTKFYYFQYGPVVIGTARPETKFRDKVIVVHPDDERYQDLIGKEFDVEWIEGTIKAKVIADECIDMDLGTGAMTITPAHSLVDFELAEKHDLDIEQIIDFEGKILPSASEKFGGMPIDEAREEIVKVLDQKGLLVKVDEEYIHNIAVNYRGKGTIEPQVMKQWFIDVNKPVIDWKGDKQSIKAVLQDVVRSEMIKIVPERFNKIYFHWIDNLRDWCISRQIWWGHRIPMWYKATQEQYEAFHAQPDGSSVLLNVLNIDGEVQFGTEKPEGEYWIQDPDTLDTWFSSALWTFSTLGWPEHTEELKTFHPTDVLETGYDILFFWVARMILASTYCLRRDGLPEEQCIPFKTVYLHGMIRDRDGKKMSKSRPETCIDPLEVIDHYGTDAVRLSLVIGSSPGNDMRLYEEKIAGYRNFVNKIWNGARFILMNLENSDATINLEELSQADRWILHRTNQVIKDSTAGLDEYRFSEVGNMIYEFFWSELCDWYLEISKIEKNEAVLKYVLETTLKLLHPFTPFITEALWEKLGHNALIQAKWPENKPEHQFPDANQALQIVIDTITGIRQLRSEYKVDPVKKIEAILIGQEATEILEKNQAAIRQLARIESLTIESDGDKRDNAASQFVGPVAIYLPLEGMIDKAVELKRLEDEIENLTQYLKKLNGKLNNQGYLNNAPAKIVEQDKARYEEAQEKLNNLKDQQRALQ